MAVRRRAAPTAGGLPLPVESFLPARAASTRSRERCDGFPLLAGKRDREDGGGADRRHPETTEPPDLTILVLEQQIRLAPSAQPPHELHTEDLLARYAERSRECPRGCRQLMRIERSGGAPACLQQHLARPEDDCGLRYMFGVSSHLPGDVASGALRVVSLLRIGRAQKVGGLVARRCAQEHMQPVLHVIRKLGREDVIAAARHEYSDHG